MTHFYVCISTRSFYGPVCAAPPDTLAAEVPYDAEVPLNEARTAAPLPLCMPPPAQLVWTGSHTVKAVVAKQHDSLATTVKKIQELEKSMVQSQRISSFVKEMLK